MLGHASWCLGDVNVAMLVDDGAAQPSCNRIRAGNLTLASALLLSGNSYTKVRMMFNFCNQQLNIIPAINEFRQQHKHQIWSERAGKSVILMW